MVYVFIKHSQEHALFFSLECLYQEPVVVREKEKRTAFACSLSSFEHHFSVVLEWEWSHHFLGRNIVILHDKSKFFILIASKSRLKLDLSRYALIYASIFTSQQYWNLLSRILYRLDSLRTNLTSISWTIILGWTSF